MAFTIVAGEFVSGPEMDRQPQLVASTQLASGGFVLVYQSASSNASLFAEIYDAHGARIGQTSIFAHNAAAPDIVSKSDGGFAIAWVNGSGLPISIMVQSFTETGSLDGAASIVGTSNPSSIARVYNPSMTETATGNLVVSWDLSDTMTAREINVRTLDSHANPVSAISTISPTHYGSGTDTLALADGRVLVEYNYGPTAAPGASGPSGIRVALYSPDGSIASTNFIDIPATSGARAGAGQLTRLASGDILVTWNEYISVNNGWTPTARGELFDSNGTALSLGFTISGQGVESVTALGDGGFAIGYVVGASQDRDVVAQIFDRNAVVVGQSFVVSNPNNLNTNTPVLTGFGSNDLAIGWTYQTSTFGPQDSSLRIYNNAIVGTASGEILTGTSDDDLLIGLDGNDSLSGLAGNDTLIGGLGADTLVGGLGNDSYEVTEAADIVSESAAQGTDQVYAYVDFSLADDVENLIMAYGSQTYGYGNALDNLIVGNAQANVIEGRYGNDRLEGGAGNDTLDGGNGDDVLIGGSGADTMIGSDGSDSYDVDNINDNVVEQAGEGSADSVSATVNYTLSDNLETLVMSAGSQTYGYGNALDNLIVGNAQANVIEGRYGNDRLEGGAGNDTLIGGLGVDTLVGGLGNDSYEVTDTADILSESAAQGTDQVYAYVDFSLADDVENLIMAYGSQTYGYGNVSDNFIIGNAQANVIDGLAGNDIIVGGAGNDNLGGGAGNDRLEGGEGIDVLLGGTGADIMIGGEGSDMYEVDSVGDVVVEVAGAGIADNVFAYVDFALPANVDNLIMVYGNQRFGAGSAGDNIIIGNGQSNVIEGGAGYDTLTGGAGSDLFIINSNFGVDVITDFQAGAGSDDAVLFSNSLFTSFNEVMANSAQVGADTWIGDGLGNTVVLVGIQQSTLHANDFGFI